MRNYFYLFVLIFFSSSAFSQLEKVIVETYYISNNADSTDTIGGKVEAGSTTYRIYIDMLPGSKLKKIYGNNDHPFSIASTDYFYNNLDGQTFAKDFIKARYGENAVALDTWLTLGQTTKKQANKTYFGLLKSQDIDGSFIGGTNNDGGSSMVSDGMLNNNDPLLGIPLTIADGMDTMVNNPDNWIDNGIKDFTTGNDSTIFGSLIAKMNFTSTNFALQNSGVSGVIPDTNQVLIAQLTTKGQLSFQINIEIEALVDGVLKTLKYVAKDTLLQPDEQVSSFLNYPYSCGCIDPNYLEFDKSFVCSIPGACQTPIVYGCSDSMACNFDSKVNFMIESLCCYPGSCANRDISVVCPSQRGDSFEFDFYPNPASEKLILNIISGESTELSYKIINSFGVVLIEKALGNSNFISNEEINLNTIDNGLYTILVNAGAQTATKLFMKY